MKKGKLDGDEMRAEYRREDLGPLLRGRYAARYSKASNVVVIEPALSRAFPNAEAVNAALRGLLSVATAAARGPVRSTRTPRKRGVE